tara:strand:- start:46 stop:855 length:810 start_codon:yes stop_codon:yes gene_type:complete
MLGLGNSLISSSPNMSWAPTDVLRPPSLWFRNNTGIVSDEAGDGSSHSHTSELGNLADEDKISDWIGHASTNLAFNQETPADKPRFETDAADFGSLAFPNAAKFMNLIAIGGGAETVDLANNFTILVRCKVTDLSSARAILGDTDQEFLRFGSTAGNLNNTIRLRIDNTALDFTEASNTFSTSEYVSIIITRDGSNEIAVFVNSATYTSTSGQEWGVTGESLNGTLSISNLGSQSNDNTNFQGFISDLIVWPTNISAAERILAFDYVRK